MFINYRNFLKTPKKGIKKSVNYFKEENHFLPQKAVLPGKFKREF